MTVAQHLCFERSLTNRCRIPGKLPAELPYLANLRFIDLSLNQLDLYRDEQPDVLNPWPPCMGEVVRVRFVLFSPPSDERDYAYLNCTGLK